MADIVPSAGLKASICWASCCCSQYLWTFQPMITLPQTKLRSSQPGPTLISSNLLCKYISILDAYFAAELWWLRTQVWGWMLRFRHTFCLLPQLCIRIPSHYSIAGNGVVQNSVLRETVQLQVYILKTFSSHKALMSRVVRKKRSSQTILHIYPQGWPAQYSSFFLWPKPHSDVFGHLGRHERQ